MNTHREPAQTKNIWSIDLGKQIFVLFTSVWVWFPFFPVLNEKKNKSHFRYTIWTDAGKKNVNTRTKNVQQKKKLNSTKCQWVWKQDAPLIIFNFHKTRRETSRSIGPSVCVVLFSMCCKFVGTKRELFVSFPLMPNILVFVFGVRCARVNCVWMLKTNWAKSSPVVVLFSFRLCQIVRWLILLCTTDRLFDVHFFFALALALFLSLVALLIVAAHIYTLYMCFSHS